MVIRNETQKVTLTIILIPDSSSESSLDHSLTKEYNAVWGRNKTWLLDHRAAYTHDLDFVGNMQQSRNTVRCHGRIGSLCARLCRKA
jgi:hypothetical protein